MSKSLKQRIADLNWMSPVKLRDILLDMLRIFDGGSGSSETNLSYNAATGEVSNDNGDGFTIPEVSTENPGLATPNMLEALKGRIVQYGYWSKAYFLSGWYDYKVLFGNTVVNVVYDFVAYSPCATGYKRYDRVEVDSDGIVSLVTGVESTGFPDKPAPTTGKVTIGFMQISDSAEYWMPVSEGFVTKESQNFQAVFGTGAVTLPITGNFNYSLQEGITQVDGIDAVLPSSHEFNRFGQEMKIWNTTLGNVVLKHSGTGLYFTNSSDFTLPSQHVASFFYEATAGVWYLTGSSVQGGGVTINNDFADDAAAATGGVQVGGLYHTAGVVKVRLL